MGKRRIERKEIIPAKKRRVVTITDKTISKRIPTRAPRMATLFLTEPASPLREGGATRDRFWSVTNNRKNGLKGVSRAMFGHHWMYIQLLSRMDGVRILEVHGSGNEVPFFANPVHRLSLLQREWCRSIASGAQSCPYVFACGYNRYTPYSTQVTTSSDDSSE